MTKQKKNLRMLAIALIFCLIGMIGSSVVQKSGNKITIKDLRWETPSGHEMSALLFIPKNATADSPAPGIVTSHGWYNNREMQDLNFVEYSRRGYVVMAIDMYGHGNSEALPSDQLLNRGVGMYDAVELMADLPYVDKSKIGVTGHSNGAMAANLSVTEDNSKDEPLISAVLLVANDAVYKIPGTENYANIYGDRDVGIVAAKYDEFFFRTQLEDGTRTVPRDYIYQDNAQSFLHFGEDPSTFDGERSSYNIYKEEVDGTEASRVIYNPGQIHPWNHFSKSVVTSSLEFFEDALPAPDPIPPTSQIWQIKVLFNLIDLIGFAMFIVNFTIAMLFTAPFASLRATTEVKALPAPEGKGKAWFWGGLIVSTIISGVTYLCLYNWSSKNKPSFFTQEFSFYIGVWSLVSGVLSLLIMFISYKLYMKNEGVNLRNSGVIISFKKFLKTIILALIVTAAAFSLVFFADYFFKTDFRVWVIAVKAFTPDKLLIALKFLPFFLVFYIANSIAVNSFNFVKLGSKEWINTAVVATFNSLAIFIIVLIQYIGFFISGEVFFTSVSSIVGIWLFPIIVILFVAAIISRKIYRATNNPYLAGFINAFIVTIIIVTNTLTVL